MSTVFVLHMRDHGAVVGVLAPVGPAQTPTLPSGRTFRLPVGEAAVPVTFKSDEIAVATVETAETDPLALFRFGVTLEQSPTVVRPATVLQPLLTDLRVEQPAVNVREIKGAIVTPVAGDPLDVALWGAGGRVAVRRVTRVPGETPFTFPDVSAGVYTVLVKGFVPVSVIVTVIL